MSVPEGKRTESKLAVQTKSKELAKYTTTICSNEKIFPKRDRWIITRDKVDDCYKSWKAHANKGNSYKLLIRMDKYYNNLWKE